MKVQQGLSCDNEGVVKNTTAHESALKKTHVDLWCNRCWCSDCQGEHADELGRRYEHTPRTPRTLAEDCGEMKSIPQVFCRSGELLFAVRTSRHACRCRTIALDCATSTDESHIRKERDETLLEIGETTVLCSDPHVWQEARSLLGEYYSPDLPRVERPMYMSGSQEHSRNKPGQSSR